MPELPEVEVVKRSLERNILNLIIKNVKINDANLRYKVDKIELSKLIGKKITKISPNKTYAGVIGSFFLSLLVSVIFFSDVNLKINILLFTIIISSISQLGDLFVSFLKRKAKIKDTGNFLPGHGGLLDRIDGILFTIPIGIILISF